MRLSVRLMLFLIIAISMTYVINTYGFGLSHSAALGFIAFLLSPGVILIFIRGGLDPLVSWVLLAAINVVYYEMIYRLISHNRSKQQVKISSDDEARL
jgi:ribose/xylose/arabinose/galactoside ABC-type transport system permease subunit